MESEEIEEVVDEEHEDTKIDVIPVQIVESYGGTVSIRQTSNSNSSNTARGKYYKQTYRPAWEQMPDFKGWLRGVEGEPTRAYCTYCQKTLHAHCLSLLKHTCTIRHQKAAQIYASKKMKNKPRYRSSLRLKNELDKIKILQEKILTPAQQLGHFSQEMEFVETVETKTELHLKLESNTGSDTETASTCSTATATEIIDVNQPSSSTVVKKKNSRKFFFGDISLTDLSNPKRVKECWKIISDTISKQRKKIRHLQQGTRRLKARIREKKYVSENAETTIQNKANNQSNSELTSSHPMEAQEVQTVIINEAPITTEEIDEDGVTQTVEYIDAGDLEDGDVEENENEEDGEITQMEMVHRVQFQKHSDQQQSNIIEKPPISTHVIDMTRGQPVSGLQVSLYKLIDGRWTYINEGVTNSNGRFAKFLEKSDFTPGRYKLHYDVDRYFDSKKQDTLYPFIEIVFDSALYNDSYHIPMVLGPYGYTTYLGS